MIQYICNQLQKMYICEMMEQLFEISNRLIEYNKSDFLRSLYDNIDWNQRLIEIKGARGVGKTTLMLQKAKELQNKRKKVLYTSADLPYFYNHTLFETAEEFYKYEGEYLYIDEIHKYPKKHNKYDWAQEIKNIYDTLPELKVVYSGSSILKLYKSQGDLSRRKTSYNLRGLSFREYLLYTQKVDIPIVKLEELINNHEKIAKDIIKNIRIISYFHSYLENGYYPFYNENPEAYFDRISEIINVIIDVDIPSVNEIAYETLHKIKQLLSVISSSVPFSPNLSNISSKLYVTDQRTLLKYINLLEKAELIKTLGAKVVGNNILNKPEKIYLNNTNLMYAIDKNNIENGTIRETFFINQLSYLHTVKYPKNTDFYIDDKYYFEIGGKNKNKKQIAGLKNAFIVKDDIETGFMNVIPLWMFGLLY